MRVTLALYKHPKRWILKNKWLTRGHLKIMPLKMAAGVNPEEVIKASDFSALPPIKRAELPRLSSFQPEKTINDHEDYKETPMYEANMNCRLLEGEKQALILTKSQRFRGSPPCVRDLIGSVSIPDQDVLVQRHIMYCNVWEPTKDKLPRRTNLDLPIWKFKAECGIPQERIIHLLLSRLVHMCQIAATTNPEISQSRRVSTRHYMATQYLFNGERQIQVSGLANLLVSSDKPTSPLGTQDMVDESVLHKLPNIHPISPMIDLVKQHIYTEGTNNTGWHQDFSHPHPHLVALATPEPWTTSQHNARGLLLAFGHAAASAQKRFGSDVGDLPEPITTQCVLTDGSNFHFIFFQLNTLNITGDKGIKNFVWFNNDNLMYNKIIPKRAMLRNTRYEDYNPEVFKHLLAMYMSGC